MTEKSRVEVEILGRKYAIRSEATAEYVQELAAHVDQRAREIQGGNSGEDPTRLLALAALYITDELFRLRDEQASADRNTGERLGALRRLLDSVSVHLETESPRDRPPTRDFARGDLAPRSGDSA